MTTSTSTSNSNSSTTKCGEKERERERDPGRRLSSCMRFLPPFRVTLTLAACVMVEATLGVSYTTANLIPYMTSYIRNMTDMTSVDYGELMWVYNSNWLVVSSIMPFLGIMERRIPNRVYALTGVGLNAVAFFATFWAIQTSFALLVVVYGVLQGIAQGILYPNFLNLALKWLPQHRGVVAGFTMGGYGGGAFIWNQVVTTWINPHNLQPDLAIEEKRYFTQPELLSRVPSCFLLMGGILTVIQLACAVVVIYPDPVKSVKSPDIIYNQTLVLDDDAIDTSTPEYKDTMADSSSPPSVAHLTPTDERYSLNSDSTAVLANDSGKVSPMSGSETETDSTGLLAFAARPELISLAQSPEARSHEEAVASDDSPTATPEEYPTFGGSCDRDDFLTVKKPSTGSGADEDVDADHAGPAASLSTPDDVTARCLNPRDAPLEGMLQYSPLAVLKLRVTWTLILNNLCMDYAFLFIVIFYKAYGQSFIPNDHLLARVASVASIFNAVGRPLWGLLADRIGYLPALLLSQGLLMVSSATFLTTELAGSSAMYMAWVWAMFTAISGIYSLQSPMVFTLFGDRCFIFSLGVITTTGVLSTLTSVPITEVILPAFGWKGIYIVAGAIALVGILVLSSLLVPCGHPIAPHMREGLMVPVRKRAAQLQAQRQLQETLA